MGYVNLSKVNQFIPPSLMLKSAGTWTATIDLNVFSQARTPEAGSFTLTIPISLFGSHVNTQGSKLLSVDLWYKVGVAALTMSVVACHKVTLPASGVDISGESYTAFTLDADHDSMSERQTVGAHKLTATFTNQPYLLEDELFFLSLALTAPATTTFSVFGAQVRFKLKL